MIRFLKVSTGLPGLDVVIDYLRDGDNVVWQIDEIEDYIYFVRHFAERSIADNKKLIYMRFAQHEPIIHNDNDNVTVYELDADSGFEAFSLHVHQIIEMEGKGAYYVFDCLSDLLHAWATDLMIGNFFIITCPYLFEMDTIAYFAILRDRHSYKTIARIRETTQLLLSSHHHSDNLYVHPLKVWERYSHTMFLPHVRRSEQFIPITNSIEAANLYTSMAGNGQKDGQRNLDYWERLFQDANHLLNKDADDDNVLLEQEKMLENLCKIMIGREERILSLVKDGLSLKDLLNIKFRLIGTGYIGGKAVGMLLARQLLMNDTDIDWDSILEPHDSYYIGSDVFYTYLVQNGWWKYRVAQRSEQGYFSVAQEMRNKILTGTFPVGIREQFQEMLDYFGQSPIIVRSSSLLEDGFGNAFAGKYESIFCVNQGSPAERYNNFENAVRRVYASTMSEDALTYRLKRGLADRDEQMALLVQRVSGSYHGEYFFPDLAGVGVSYNTYVWKNNMNPKAGMLRLVFGLGTRAVDRVEGDYPRIIALDAPLITPNADMEDKRRFSQHEVDLLNTVENEWQSRSLNKLMSENTDIKMSTMELLGIPDNEINLRIRELGIKGQTAWILTYDRLLTDTPFISIMQKMLKFLEAKYQYPVDIEYAINFVDDKEFRINLLQCRPLQTKGKNQKVTIPKNIDKDKIIFQSMGNFMGGSILQTISRIIVIDAQAYCELSISTRYEVARLVGKLNRLITSKIETPTLLMGPGRWGTTTPTLGVPVTFSEISNFSVLVEVEFSNAGLVPELSFGTHFFQDLVETGIFYSAIFPQNDNVIFNLDLLNSFPNSLDQVLGSSSKLNHVIKVYDFKSTDIQIRADIITQKVVCFSS